MNNVIMLTILQNSIQYLNYNMQLHLIAFHVSICSSLYVHIHACIYVTIYVCDYINMCI